MDSSYIYHESTDTLFVLVYKLGESQSEIWFALEYKNFIQQVKTKKQTIVTRALKIFTEDDKKNADKEIGITNVLKINGNTNNNINYPVGHFKCVNDKNKTLTIVLYDVMVGSIYDVLEEINEISISSVHKIIDQMVHALHFIHHCGYVHTDIKIDNVLVVGNTIMQTEIFNYATSYNIIAKIPKTITKKNIHDAIEKIIDTFADKLTEKFDLYDLINNFDDSGECSDSYDSEGRENDTTESSTEEDDCESSDEESDVSCSKTESFMDDQSANSNETYYSSNGRYNEEYNIFHEGHIMKKIADEQKMDVSHQPSKKLTKDQLHLIKIMENPIIKITDFDLLLCATDTKKTTQMRVFRSPEIILGFDYDKAIDYWAFGHFIMELIIGHFMIDIKRDSMCNVYDRDFVTIKLFFEKMCYNAKTEKDLLDMIKLSKRRDYFINKDGTLKFIKELNCNYWVNNIADKKIKCLLDGLFKMNPVEREIVW